MVQENLPTSEDVKDLAGQEVKATITRCDVSTWRDVIDNEESLKKFNNPDARVLDMDFETEDGITFNKTVNYPKPLTDVSLLGRLLKRWGSVEVGTDVTVYFDNSGLLQLEKTE